MGDELTDTAQAEDVDASGNGSEGVVLAICFGNFGELFDRQLVVLVVLACSGAI